MIQDSRFKNKSFKCRNLLRHSFPESCFLNPVSARSAGFALGELLVALALLGIISVFVMLAYNRVSGQLFVTTLAYELALSFGQAQSYGVSVHQFGLGEGATFDVGYGLHFDAGSRNTYALFADQGGAAGNGLFDGIFDIAYTENGCVSTVECVSVFRFERGNTLYKFCGVLPTGDAGRDAPDEQKHEECTTNSTPPGSPPPNIAFLDVTFLRPNPDAIIKTNRSAAGVAYKAARVYVISPTGEKRVVEVTTTGQISVK